MCVSTLGLMDCRIKTSIESSPDVRQTDVSTLGLMDCRIKTHFFLLFWLSYGGFNPWFDGL